MTRRLSIECGKAFGRWCDDGLLQYIEGRGVDIGYRGEVHDAEPVVPGAIGIDRDFPGYDGLHLPFSDNVLDFVFSSHMFEHIPLENQVPTLREWHRVVRIGGHIVTTVPHRDLYEKRLALPSKYNGDHKALFTPAILLAAVESALEPNSYRVRRLQDCDARYTYDLPPQIHAGGEYQIELVLEKIRKPQWDLLPEGYRA